MFFQCLLAQILELEVETVAHVIADGTRDRDPAGLRNALQARRDVDPVAKDIFPFHNHVAKVDPDPNSSRRSCGTLAFRSRIPR